jgi:hypothetical protein
MGRFVGLSETTPASARLLRMLPCDVVFVCGTYKSGTSLAAALLNRVGFANPANLSNPTERGYGTTIPRYHTLECQIARTINVGLVGGRRASASAARRAIRDYLHEIRRPAVVKDPRFVYTLEPWLMAVLLEGWQPGVIFTTRPHEALTAAWDAAPLTRPLLGRRELQNMLRAQCLQWERCQTLNVRCAHVTLDELRRLTPNLPFGDAT